MHSNGKILFSWQKNCLSKFLWCTAHVYFFFFKENFCVLARIGKSLVKCSLSEDSCWKNDISGFIWHKSFIKTGKCSSFKKRIVYQNFYGALLTRNYFFFKEKFVFYSHASTSRLQDVYIESSVPKTLWKKLYIRLYLTQTVHSNGKMLFF